MAKYFGVLFAVLWLMSGCATVGGDDETIDDKVTTFTTTLQTIIDGKIPAELLQQSEAIAVADLKKGGFVVGFEAGKGLLSVREGQQWSNPVFIELASASFGFQAGVEIKQVVLVFTNREAVNNLLAGQLKLGAGLDLSAGPLAAEVSTGTIFDKDVYSYSDGMGLFAGLSLEGASLAADNYSNEQLYGKAVSADEILTGSATTNSPAVQKLKAMLRDKT
jgi:lipid-binding SYLF domain-containing protein